MSDTLTVTNTETFYVLFDEPEQGFVGTDLLGIWATDPGSSHPVREEVTYLPDYNDHRVVRFNSPEAANNWLAPGGGYERSRATLILVLVEYTAEAV